MLNEFCSSNICRTDAFLDALLPATNDQWNNHWQDSIVSPAHLQDILTQQGLILKSVAPLCHLWTKTSQGTFLTNQHINIVGQ